MVSFIPFYFHLDVFVDIIAKTTNQPNKVSSVKLQDQDVSLVRLMQQPNSGIFSIRIIIGKKRFLISLLQTCGTLPFKETL